MDIRRSIGVLALLLASAGGLPVGLSAQEYAETDANALEARVWLDRGEEPLLQRGDRVRIYYRASADAYTAIFHIDTDGAVQLLHPRAPDDDDYARGGRDYRLLFPQTPYWFVDEDPGKGYFFLVASPEPFDLSAFDYARYAGGWDLTNVGRAVYQDPYVAIDEYVARLIPDWETVPYALDFISYDVGEAHDYPRFLCYDCHGYQSYASWNPYTYACSSFRVVIWDDPYFYPAYRYRGTRVVFAQPPRGIVRFEFKERARGEAWSPIVRTRQPPLRGGAVGYREPAVAAPAMREFVPPRRRVVPSDALRDGGATNARPGTARTPTSTRTAQPRSGTTRSGVLPGGSARPPTSTRGTPTRATPSSRGGVTPTRTNPPSGRASSFPGRTGRGTSVPSTRQRPTLQRRPTTQAPPARSGGGTRVVRPSTGSSGSSRPSTRGSSGSLGSRIRSILPTRPSTSRPSTSRPSTSRPSTSRPSRPRPTVRSQPSRTGGSSARPSRPAAKPPARSGGGARASKPTRRKPGGGRTSAPKRRKPGGGS